MLCHHCKKDIEIDKKVSFRQTCPNCDWDFHCCLNCKHYLQGKPNDCFIPNIDLVLDKQSNNFCEEFKPTEKKEHKTKDINQTGKSLFKDHDEIKKTDFNSLFKDD